MVHKVILRYISLRLSLMEPLKEILKEDSNGGGS